MSDTRVNPVFCLSRWLCRQAFRFYGSWRIEGHQNIPAEGPAIVVCNHTSFVDPPLVGSAMRRPVAFMAKSDLFDRPVLGRFYRMLKAYPVRQGTADREAIRQTLELLGQGWAIGMFPEGHRSEDGKLQGFQEGLGLIALRSKAPVVPCGVAGTFEMLPPHSLKPRRSHLEVHFGAPVDLAGLYESDDRRTAVAEICRRAHDAVASVSAEAQAARTSWLDRR